MRALVVGRDQSPALSDGWTIAPPSTGELRVKVSACGLNFADLLMIKGTYQETPPPPFVPGLEICGEVVELGQDTEGFKPGDRIAAFCGSGGLAEEVVVDRQRCRIVPASMPGEVAAGFQIAYGTSHLALTRRARLVPGETLVVLGAAGGVGLTAVEIGHALGARVIAVARGDEKRQIAICAGADEALEPDADALRDQLRALGGADVVYDAVGGALGEAAIRALKPEGRYLAIGFASGDVPRPKLNHLLVKNIDVIGFYWGGYLAFDPTVLTDSLGTLMDWHQIGRIKPRISHVLPLNQVLDGLDHLKSRKATGKVVITL